MTTKLAEAYEMINEVTVLLQRLAEQHLKDNPLDANFNYLLVFDDTKGGTTISHSYETEDGGPDVHAALLALTLAWRNIHASAGGIVMDISDDLPTLMAKMDEHKETQ